MILLGAGRYQNWLESCEKLVIGTGLPLNVSLLTWCGKNIGCGLYKCWQVVLSFQSSSSMS